MATAFVRDYQFGTSQEDKLLPALNNVFGELRKTAKTCRWDYESDTTLYELKSRNNCYNAYPTTLLPFDKVIEGKQQVFLFHFTDGLYYIQYDPVVFEAFEKKEFRRWRQGVNDKQKPYLYIPITSLTPIERGY